MQLQSERKQNMQQTVFTLITRVCRYRKRNYRKVQVGFQVKSSAKTYISFNGNALHSRGMRFNLECVQCTCTSRLIPSSPATSRLNLSANPSRRASRDSRKIAHTTTLLNVDIFYTDTFVPPGAVTLLPFCYTRLIQIKSELDL